MHDEAQMRKHELTGGAQVILAPKAFSKLALFVAAQNWNTADPVQVSVEASERTGKSQVTMTRDDCSTCGH
jgi:hypothetical protein